MVQFNHKQENQSKEIVIDEYKCNITKPVFLDSETLKPELSYVCNQRNGDGSPYISHVHINNITYDTEQIPLPRFLQDTLKEHLYAHLEGELNTKIKDIPKGPLDRQKQRIQEVWVSILDDYPNRSTFFNVADWLIDTRMKEEIFKQAIQNMTTLFHGDDSLSNFHRCSDGRYHYSGVIRFNAFDDELKISTGYEENSYLIGGFDVYFNII